MHVPAQLAAGSTKPRGSAKPKAVAVGDRGPLGLKLAGKSLKEKVRAASGCLMSASWSVTCLVCIDSLRR